jgi:hypothetical protein
LAAHPEAEACKLSSQGKTAATIAKVRMRDPAIDPLNDNVLWGNDQMIGDAALSNLLASSNCGAHQVNAKGALPSARKRTLEGDTVTAQVIAFRRNYARGNRQWTTHAASG